VKDVGKNYRLIIIPEKALRYLCVYLLTEISQNPINRASWVPDVVTQRCSAVLHSVTGALFQNM
jgi:hypothetical protein